MIINLSLKFNKNQELKFEVSTSAMRDTIFHILNSHEGWLCPVTSSSYTLVTVSSLGTHAP
jgi:hypothetical protein